MTISLSQMIADLNAKIAAADSNTPIATVLQYVTEAERLGGGQIIYDSSGVLPSDSAYEGMIAYVADSATLKVRGDYGWAGIADSASVYVEPYTFQGSVSGYTSGGRIPAISNVIEKFSFTADTNATDVGDLSVTRSDNSGQSSNVSGYTSGGRIPTNTPQFQNVIDKFPFATDGNATDVGDLTVTRSSAAGQSSSDNGYTSGGFFTPPTTYSTTIDKFPFAVDANATDVGDVTQGVFGPTGQSSTTNGYTSGGNTPAYINDINKFSFSTDANAADVGDLTAVRSVPAGQSSTDNGYTSGGQNPALPTTATNVIDKFPFASDANATDVGDLLINRRIVVGQSSTTNGYSSGGIGDPVNPGNSNIIDKFPFASDANATDVGDLTVAKYDLAGQQV